MALRYELMPLESGVFAELYLPKKAHYQGLLYDTLTNGFEVEQVRRHLRQKRKEIQTYLGGSAQYWEIAGQGDARPEEFLNDAFIRRFPDLLHGYTMYEVDGVFRSPSTGKVVEERTQIIRLMFITDLDRQFARLKFIDDTNREAATLLARAYLRSPHWDRSRFLDDQRMFASTRTFDEREATAIVQLTAEWARYIAVFLFGYVVHEICEGLKKLHQDDKATREEEIWVTFFWNLIINRIRSHP